MMNRLYILDADGQPEPCDDFFIWAVWHESPENVQLAFDEFPGGSVSTVFLAFDHCFTTGEHVPLLWETLVRGGSMNQYAERYGSRSEAIAGHVRILDVARTAANVGSVFDHAERRAMRIASVFFLALWPALAAACENRFALFFLGAAWGANLLGIFRADSR